MAGSRRPVPSPRTSSPPEGRARWLALRARRPLERFVQIEAASGIVLFVAAAIALGWASSPWAGVYFRLWDLSLGAWGFERSLAFFVNDGLMVIFFFVVGLEIRGEIHSGELSDRRRAALPAAAALGGMLVPAGLYLLFARGPGTHAGWGVPMATDIAFALGVLSLLGKRVPPALRVLLLALAVIDDLGAIMVIALFYSPAIEPLGAIVAAIGFGGIVLMQRVGVDRKLAYVAPGLLAWAGVYAAGVHPTIAGVIIGLMTPVRVAQGPKGLIAMLHPWVAFAIMPIFALANAGVSLGGNSAPSGADPAVTWSVGVATAIALLVGKPVGVLLACGLAIRTRIGALPTSLSARHLVVLGLIAGIGFTMSLFVAQLAFSDPTLLEAAKKGVLVASATSAILGVISGRMLLPPGARDSP